MAQKDEKQYPLWKNQGEGTFRISKNRRIKPQEKFHAPTEIIPEVFRSGSKPQIVKLRPGADELLEEEKEQKFDKELSEAQPKFYIEGRGGPWYDVKSAEGEAMNHKALHIDEAEKLRDQLNGKKPMESPEEE